jgi:hypothetical protein
VTLTNLSKIIRPFISAVSPVQGCETCLFKSYFRLQATLEKITTDFEIILVNDALTDRV